MSDYHNELRSMLFRDREAAYQIALYQRSQKDNLTTKLCFGLVVLNGASIVALLGAATGSGSFISDLGFTPGPAFRSIVAFIVGAASGGVSLWAQQNLLIKQAGASHSRARLLDTAVSKASDPPDSETFKELPNLIDEANKLELTDTKFSFVSIACQNISAAAWLWGIVTPVTGHFCHWL